MRAARTAFLVLATVLIAAGTAPAADDGGGRSVFARGAGERALGLGGAYGAVTGGAQSLFWNPAGLARVKRISFEASHTNLIGLGFHEQYGAVAVPSWRLGTFAFAVRRFGVDGIEGRDDRGAITDDNLSDAESELSVGYARTLGEAWSFGAAVKFQQHELAGNSGSGLGLDLGLVVRPLVAAGRTSDLARGFRLGATFRNLIEPEITLADDPVPDPTSVRLGTALELTVGRHMDILAAVDLERTRDLDARVHAGFEAVLMDILALRVGSHDGTLAAGGGVRWRQVGIDYAFEDNPLSSVHRFGIGLVFGPTSAERRQASLDQAESDLQNRLARVMADENRRRTDTMVRAISNEIAAGDDTEALRGVNALRVLAPSHPRTDELEAGAYFVRGRNAETDDDLTGAMVAYQNSLRLQPGDADVQGDLARVRGESQRRAQRSLSLAAHYDRGMDHYAAGDLDSARVAFAGIVRLEPNDDDARAMLGHVENAIRTRNETEAARLQAEQAVARARDAARRNVTPPTAAAASAPSNTPAPVRPTFAALSANRQREIADLYRRGVDAAEAGRRDDAVAYWEMVWSAAPDYQRVTEHLKQEYLARGLDAFSAGRLDEAIEVWESALRVAPGDERTQGYLARAYEHKTRIREIRSGDR
ncbi:MAG: PorV/PorQ family protein [bacterium]|nr:PorV/PorQ family protein [bacterium]